MSYVAKQLVDDERIVHVTTIHPVIFAWPLFLWSTIVTMTLIDLEAGLATGVPLSLIAGPYLIAAALRHRTTEIAVTNQRVLIKSGLIRRKTAELLLSSVEDLEVEQGITGRLLEYGTIQVTGTGGASEPFHFIDGPIELRRQVRQAASTISAGTAQRQTAAVT